MEGENIAAANAAEAAPQAGAAQSEISASQDAVNNGVEKSEEAGEVNPSESDSASHDEVIKAEPQAGEAEAAAGGETGEAEAEKSEAEKAEADEAVWDQILDAFGEKDSPTRKIGESFKELARADGMSAERATKWGEWFEKASAMFQESQMKAGQQALRELWGNKAESNRLEALRVMTLADRKCGGIFIRDMERSGAAFYPGIVAGLYELSRITAEDRLNVGSQGGNSEPTESALDGIRDVFRKAGKAF